MAVVGREGRVLRGVDRGFFFVGAAAAAYAVYLTVQRIVLGGLHDWWLVLVVWLLVAYLFLPRVQTILAHIYVPDYFIGRTLIREGLLGDPVNIGILGTEQQVRTAMEKAGWQLADQLGFRSGLRIVVSTLSRRTYPNAPVSGLYLFNRLQDFAFEQQVDNTPAQRHHVRFWRTAPGWRLPGGASVDWLAAGTFDRKVGISDFTLQITHKVADDTDVERDHVVDGLLSSDPAATKTVITHFSSGYHSRNGGGDAIETDGNLPIVDLTKLDAVERHVSHPSLRGQTSLATEARAVFDVVRDTSASNQSRRPLSVYTGSSMILLRVVVAVVAVLTSGAAGSSTWWLAVVAVVVVGAGYLVLGNRTFTGHPGARILAMSVSVAAIVLVLVFGDGGDELARALSIIGLGLDLAIIFTLSGDDAREYQPGARPVTRK